MANSHFLVLFVFLSVLRNTCRVNSSTCSLDFKRFPYEAPGECLNSEKDSIDSVYPCCESALQTIFQVLSLRANATHSIFLDPVQGHDCREEFEGLHNKTDLSVCNLEEFICSSPSANGSLCSKDVDSVIGVVGIKRYDDLRLSCRDMPIGNYSDDACYKCVGSYRASLEVLRNATKGGERVCAEALLVSLASSDVESVNWVQGIFSCLWDEIKFPLPSYKSSNESSFFKSKKVIALSVLVLLMVILAPILYKFTRRRLGDESRKEIEDLSVRVLKSTVEEDCKNPFGDSGLYIFSEDEVAKATNSFNDSLVIGEGHMGKMYLGVLPSGMRVAVRIVNQGIKFINILAKVNEIAKIRHPNLISILGYCDEGDTKCLVYEYCSNGSLDNWLTGDGGLPSLTWECRLQLAIGVAQGLWFLQNNPVQKMVHGDLKLTNILLNERLEPKLLDFGLPSNPKPKELHSLNNLANDDIFHFGLLLLQLFSGRIIVNSNPSTSKSLINEAKKAMAFGGNMCSLMDPRLNGAYDANAFLRILALALQCTVPSVHDRPSIEEVLNKLHHAT